MVYAATPASPAADAAATPYVPTKSRVPRKRGLAPAAPFAALLCVLAAWTISVGDAAIVGSRSNSAGQQQRWRGADSYDLVSLSVSSQQAVINSTVTQSYRVEHLKNISLTVTVGSTSYTLDLTINRNLIATSYSEKIITAEGYYFADIDVVGSHCYYTGVVRGIVNSTAAASTCDGVVGYFVVNNDSYHIMPQSDNNASAQAEGGCLSCLHKVYHGLPSDKLFNNLRCGVTNAMQSARRKRAYTILDWPQDLDGQTRLVELYLVIDSGEAQIYGSGVTTRIKSIVNMASLFYQSQDIYLVLVGVEIWSSGNLINIVTSNATQTLINFLTYVQASVTATFDDAGLVTSLGPFEGQYLGLGLIGSLCTKPSGFFISDQGSLPVSATVFAHEIGHTFGLLHDDQYPTSCPCSETSGNCIMHPETSEVNPPTHWSTCSVTNLASALPLDTCLSNMPATVYGQTTDSPMCGNGLVETGEQCDCGNAPTTECNPTCCSSVTCQLIAPAACAFGRCCNVATCQIQPAYTVCRAATNQCDLSEYCSGCTNLCPPDVHVSDFTSCSLNSVSAYCYGGQCNTPLSQCQFLWGSSAVAANALCFTNLNVLGSPQGNCGPVTPGVYTSVQPCSAANSLCGLLQCDKNSSTTPQYTQGLLGAGLANVTYGSTVYSCTEAVYKNLYNGQNDGMVPNGASCGSSSVCVNQTCLPVSASTSTAGCPNCNSQGVCNNLGHCHCNVGYAPPTCSQPGVGGSVDSNGIAPLSGTTGSASPCSSTTTATTTPMGSPTLSTSPATTTTTAAIAATTTTMLTTTTTAPIPTTTTTSPAATTTTGSPDNYDQVTSPASAMQWNNLYFIPIGLAVGLFTLTIVVGYCASLAPESLTGTV